MCLLVIMCGLALIRTGLAAVVSDKSGDNSGCFQECVSRCQQSLKARASNCSVLCEATCSTSSRAVPNRLLDGSNVPSPQNTARRRPSRSPTLREAAVIARSVGLDLGGLGEDNVGGEDGTAAGVQVSPRLVSLVPGKGSVAAVVSWDLAPGTPWYLVTWEPQGGGVRGNLVVNSTSASLSLWPDTLYHVQVSTSTGAASSCLEVDTHSPSGPTLAATLDSRVEDLGGVFAAVVLFLAIVLVVLRWRRGRIPSKNIQHNRQDCQLFKQYPPPVTLVVSGLQLSA